MPEGAKVAIKPAKGRHMLTWVGKRTVIVTVLNRLDSHTSEYRERR